MSPHLMSPCGTHDQHVIAHVTAHVTCMCVTCHIICYVSSSCASCVVVHVVVYHNASHMSNAINAGHIGCVASHRACHVLSCVSHDCVLWSCNHNVCACVGACTSRHRVRASHPCLCESNTCRHTPCPQIAHMIISSHM